MSDLTFDADGHPNRRLTRQSLTTIGLRLPEGYAPYPSTRRNQQAAVTAPQQRPSANVRSPGGRAWVPGHSRPSPSTPVSPNVTSRASQGNGASVSSEPSSGETATRSVVNLASNAGQASSLMPSAQPQQQQPSFPVGPESSISKLPLPPPVTGFPRPPPVTLSINSCPGSTFILGGTFLVDSSFAQALTPIAATGSHNLPFPSPYQQQQPPVNTRPQPHTPTPTPEAATERCLICALAHSPEACTRKRQKFLYKRNRCGRCLAKKNQHKGPCGAVCRHCGGEHHLAISPQQE